MRVLIVDDESLIRMDLKDQLESQGHRVVGQGRTGVEALDLVKTIAADVLLMDIKMPELDGIEAARQICHLNRLPVVLLTAYSQQELVKKARESGVYGYLIKPVREEQLVPALEMALGRFKDEQVMQEMMVKEKEKRQEQIVIHKAVGLIQEQYGLAEEEAYKRIRQYSMDKKRPMIAVCQQILKQRKK